MKLKNKRSGLQTRSREAIQNEILKRNKRIASLLL